MQTTPPTHKSLDNDAMVNVVNAFCDSDNVGHALFDRQFSLVNSADKFCALLGIPSVAAEPRSTQIDAIIDAIKSVIPQSELSKVGSKPNLKSNLEDRVAAGENFTLRHRCTPSAGNSFKTSCQTFSNGYTLFAIEDVTQEENDKRILNLGLEIGSSGYWSYNFADNKFFFSDLIRSRWSDNDKAKVKAKGLFGIIHPEDLSLIQNEWLKTLGGDGLLDVTYRVRLEKHGDLWLHNVGRMQYDENGKKLIFVAFVRDITEDRKLRDELLATQQASFAKSDFLAKMSHEIKTPLNAIIGMSDALSQEDLPDDVMETVSFITNAAEGLNGLLSQTLDHAKLLSGNAVAFPEETSIHRLVKNTCGMWKISCKNKGIELDYKVSNTIPETILLDQHRFQQCLNNLLSNAIKFTPRGKVSVAVTTRETPTGKSALIVSVKDSGIGMNDQAVRTIFEPFKQADDSITRRFGGTGLGMAITKQLVEVLGGKISVRSHEGKGTMFLIALPLNVAEAAKPQHVETPQQARQNAPSLTVETPPVLLPEIAKHKQRVSLNESEAGRFSGLRIMVVEDNPINQAVVRKLISKEVLSLTFTGNGVEALQALHTQSFDLILMDIHMPIKDGIETTIEIRASNEAWANVIIIALTADPDYQQQRICRNIGMNDAIAKPVKRQDILDAIERAISPDEQSQRMEHHG